jgi:hypothetical protein
LGSETNCRRLAEEAIILCKDGRLYSFYDLFRSNVSRFGREAVKKLIGMSYSENSSSCYEIIYERKRIDVNYGCDV